MNDAGWSSDRFEVIVIQPMLEAWLWADNENIAKLYGFKDYPELVSTMTEQGHWDAALGKPVKEHLKQARNLAAKKGGLKTGGRLFSKVFESLSGRAMTACSEPGFQQMRTRLKEWFPMDGGAA